MLSGSQKEKTFFDKLVSFKDEINQQIPLAANRYEDWDCPPIGSDLRDIKIQQWLHEGVIDLLAQHYVAQDILNKAFQEYQHEKPTTPLKAYMEMKLRSVDSRLTRIWQLRKRPFNASFEKALENLHVILQSALKEDVFALEIDEDKIIAAHLEEIRKDAASVIDKITHVEKLTESDIRRNIDELEKKVKAREHSYLKRFNASEKLVELRNALEENLIFSNLSTFIQSTENEDDEDDGVEIKKTIQALKRHDVFERGLHLQTHKYDTGFCDEHAAYGLVKIVSHWDVTPDIRLEKVSINYRDTNDGHTFIVLNRAKESDLSDITTWGDQAILFDAWHKLVCYAKDLNQQPRQYHVSFPKNADWTTLEFEERDYMKVCQLQNMHHQFKQTGNLNPTAREARLLEEYNLVEIAPEHPFISYLNSVIEKYQPTDDKQPIKFYISDTGNQLIKLIPGFRTPVIAIHPSVFNLLLNQTMSLTALEFAIVTIIMQLKMFSSFTSPVIISPDSRLKIDAKSMEKVSSTDAAIEYLRLEGDFEKQCKKAHHVVRIYEDAFAGFKYGKVFTVTAAQRIKALQMSIAGNVHHEVKTTLSFANAEMNHDLRELNNTTIPTQSFFTIDSACKDNASILKQLLEQIDILAIELLPYEEHEAPSIRLREFCSIIENLNIDYNNPTEAAVVDQIIDRANSLKIPGFVYLYFAFASPLGTHFPAHCNVIHYRDKTTFQRAYANTYHLVGQNIDELKLYYANNSGKLLPININKVPGLKTYLDTLNFDDKISYSEVKIIEFILYQFKRLRPLGFFKSVQAAVTAFTQSASYEEALHNAKALQTLRQQHLAHLNDGTNQFHCFQHKKNNTERHYGSDLGKLIRWVGFDQVKEFIAWAQQDKSGLLASTLFRLGINVNLTILNAMPEKELNEIAELSDYRSYCFLGGNNPKCSHLFQYDNFEQLKIDLIVERAQRFTLDDSMFSDTSLTFEEAFKKFYDQNLPGLLAPNLTVAQNPKASERLLKEFYRVAISGSDEDKNVVKSFFNNRSDKRDLQSLLGSGKRFVSLSLYSNYMQFVLLQNWQGNAHHLFDEYDMDKFFRYLYPPDYTGRKAAFLNHLCIAFRLPQKQNIDDAFIALLDAIFNLPENRKGGYDYWKTNIITTYFSNTITNTLFSKPIYKCIESLSERLLHLDENIKNTFTDMSWPNLTNTTLDEWSIDELLKYYHFFDLHILFPSNTIREQFGNIILQRILSLPDDQQIDFLEAWLFSDNQKIPIFDILIKNKVIERLIELYVSKFGIDDGSVKYRDNIMPLLSELFSALPTRDLTPFLSKFLSAIETQKYISDAVGIRLNADEYSIQNKNNNQKYGLIILINLANFFSNTNEDQAALIDFLVAPLTADSLNTLIEYIEKNNRTQELFKALAIEAGHTSSQNHSGKEIRKRKLSLLLNSMHNQFWDCSLLLRATITEQILIPADLVLTAQLQTEAYERGLQLIAKKLFPKLNDADSDDYLALSMLNAYLQTADNYVRSYLLAGLLVANNEHSGQAVGIGKKIASVCENMGPAYVKIAQAIHSHPNTPNHIRADLNHIKGRANPPTRWALWRQLAEVLPANELKKIKHVGHLLGSASYNLALEVTLEDNSNVVLLLLRENAEKSAREGFIHLRNTVNHCQHQTIIEQKEMMSDTIDEAARLSTNEMTKEASDQQSQLAKKLYPSEMTVEVGAREFNMTIATASILQSGHGYRFIDRIEGQEFNELPDKTEDERLIKKVIAKAVLTMELHNIFRGGPFDSDRHGNQLRIQMQPLHLGLYDFGEMALDHPTDSDINLLADILKTAPSNLASGKTLDQIISERITLCREQGVSTHYLMRLRKAFLAMHDFLQYLSSEDLISCLAAVAKKDDIHPKLQEPLGLLALFAYSTTEIKKKSLQISNWFNQFGLFKNADVVDDENLQPFFKI